ncbi:hypothetical protein PAXRUDRAFT_136022 [Paxillus rubicundulus Ve08.2h10]|uniref:Uncharacterized protein n=1 Tax=Paxillus rubicundulus Ve08.2h10 TaxID=930991 RepID=A0A0D0E7C1_9AGAM|nr:hypothetical protein PAXRUDRAFT_136022 [Paxillus rubicundulus Ve08.2h10]
MGNCCISNNIKECTLHLWEIGWTNEDISFASNVSCLSLYFWEALFNELCTVTQPPSLLQGLTSILTQTLLTACEELYAQESDLYLDKVITWLALVHDIEISPSTLSCNLKEASLT